MDELISPMTFFYSALSFDFNCQYMIPLCLTIQWCIHHIHNNKNMVYDYFKTYIRYLILFIRVQMNNSCII